MGEAKEETSMNRLEKLRDDLIRRFPDLSAEIDAPAEESGPAFLDLRRDGDVLPLVVVEWRPDRGFGVSAVGANGNGYGIGPDHVYDRPDEAFNQIVRMVLRECAVPESIP